MMSNFVRSLAAIAACAGVLAACSQQNDSLHAATAVWQERPNLAAGATAPRQPEMSRASAAPAALAAQVGPAIRRGESLAYEHHVGVELSKELLPGRLRELQDNCASNKNLACTLLDVSLSSANELPSGTVRMRLAPAGVEPVVAMAAKGGEITSRNTHAEDLAEPVADTERQLALLTTHRDRLTELMKSKDIKIEQLIVVSKELASVQSQLDQLGTQRANLRRRIDTELLTISLQLPQHAYQVGERPVRDAFLSFGANVLHSIGAVIRFVAVLLPWLIILVPGLILLRLFWRWITGWLARRARAPAG
jgi:hypothetical protein